MITSCEQPIERADVSDQIYHFLLILWAELYKGSVQSPGAIFTVGVCVSYDGKAFIEVPAIREEW